VAEDRADAEAVSGDVPFLTKDSPDGRGGKPKFTSTRGRRLPIAAIYQKWLSPPPKKISLTRRGLSPAPAARSAVRAMIPLHAQALLWLK
jgi:hypothetical protein